MAAAVQRDTIVSFCATDVERREGVLLIHSVARAQRPFAPNCGPYLPILARPQCFLHIAELVIPRFLMICEEGKFLVERVEPSR